MGPTSTRSTPTSSAPADSVANAFSSRKHPHLRQRLVQRLTLPTRSELRQSSSTDHGVQPPGEDRPRKLEAEGEQQKGPADKKPQEQEYAIEARNQQEGHQASNAASTRLSALAKRATRQTRIASNDIFVIFQQENAEDATDKLIEGDVPSAKPPHSCREDANDAISDLGHLVLHLWRQRAREQWRGRHSHSDRQHGCNLVMEVEAGRHTSPADRSPARPNAGWEGSPPTWMPPSRRWEIAAVMRGDA
mmetsp:Transcript_50865/g.164557  ORF Transcript_50865/g.164557 Transcript_50865/m.164557 type:complete len:248 (+) Transcript_50865:224-967(+)